MSGRRACTSASAEPFKERAVRVRTRLRTSSEAAQRRTALRCRDIVFISQKVIQSMIPSYLARPDRHAGHQLRPCAPVREREGDDVAALRWHVSRGGKYRGLAGEIDSKSSPSRKGRGSRREGRPPCKEGGERSIAKIAQPQGDRLAHPNAQWLEEWREETEPEQAAAGAPEEGAGAASRRPAPR